MNNTLLAVMSAMIGAYLLEMFFGAVFDGINGIIPYTKAVFEATVLLIAAVIIISLGVSYLDNL